MAIIPTTLPARELTDAQIREIERHYQLDQYMVGGCLLGATVGAVAGIMTLSGITVIAAVPYIATGCSMGFLIGASSQLLYDYLSPAAPSLDLASTYPVLPLDLATPTPLWRGPGGY